MKCTYCMQDHTTGKWTNNQCPTCGAQKPIEHPLRNAAGTYDPVGNFWPGVVMPLGQQQATSLYPGKVWYTSQDGSIEIRSHLSPTYQEWRTVIGNTHASV